MHLPQHRLGDSLLLLLARRIELIEPGRQLARPRLILHREQLHHIAGHVHAAGGVDARRYAEGYLGCAEGCAWGCAWSCAWSCARSCAWGCSRQTSSLRSPSKFAKLQQCLQSGIHHPIETPQAKRHHGAVLAHQRDRVGHRRNGHNFQKGRNQPRPSGALQQCLRQLEGHARAAQEFAGIAAIGLVGIQHRQRPRNAFARHQMVVGDDQVHPRALGGLGGGKGTDAGVHADDQPDSVGGGALDHLVAHAVAFQQPVWHVEVAAAAQQLHRRLQNDGGQRAVHVVVAVDQHGLTLGDGTLQPLDGLGHAQHFHGRVQLIERRMKKAATLGHRSNTARDQQGSDDLGQIQGGRQFPHADANAGSPDLPSRGRCGTLGRARRPAHAQRSSSSEPSAEPSIMIPPRSSAISCSAL